MFELCMLFLSNTTVCDPCLFWVDTNDRVLVFVCMLFLRPSLDHLFVLCYRSACVCMLLVRLSHDHVFVLCSQFACVCLCAAF